eukprot:TRINITY_DN6921_c1_g1_i2.p1 TRINITY_DN6921_c1_g1~~TRINITY_DN6921_c1_g1_i2.p1  ORF type:complete len:200 (+),score=59.28 TRINITY_DN6921_c1_g1_i2:168-767(+)
MSKNHAATANKMDLVEQAAIYGSYHNNLYNRIIHFFFVPMIIYAFAVWFALVPLHFNIPILTSINPSVLHGNLSLVLLMALCGYYCIFDPIVAGLLAVLFSAFSFHANHIVVTHTTKETLLLGLVLQVLGWGAQVAVGHAIFEGRRPALTDSLFQVFVSPYFVAVENMFSLGYRKDLAEKIEKRTQELIAEWKAAAKKH